MENSWLLLALVILATLALISKIIENRCPPNKNLPPGPNPWPIIGNLNLLGLLPHQSLHHLSKKYGDIMLLKFGKFPVVIASSPEMAKQFLKVYDAAFASRPPLAAAKYTSFNYSDVSWSPYGPYWRQARKIYLLEVFNAKRLEFFEQIRVEERRDLFSRLCSLSGKPVMLRDQLSHLILSTISRMVLGNKYFSERKDDKSFFKLGDFQEMVQEWFFLGGVINIGDWIPWLSFLDMQGYVKRMKVLSKKMDRFYEYVIDDHQARIRSNAEMDMVDVLLKQAEDPNLEVRLTRDCVKGLLHDLLVGSTDTSTITIEWAIHEILKQPRIMKKPKDELDSVIGRKRWVEENDFSQLPYINAIIMESFRLHPLATLLAPHYSTEDCKVSGYDIATGTTILINSWNIGRDPNSWDAPQEFLPERFMENKVDMLGSNFALLPFGSGRRRCPGHNLGLKIVRTTLANLVHGFEMKFVEGVRAENICMEEEYGLTTRAKQPLSILWSLHFHNTSTELILIVICVMTMLIQINSLRNFSFKQF